MPNKEYEHEPLACGDYVLVDRGFTGWVLDTVSAIHEYGGDSKYVEYEVSKMANTNMDRSRLKKVRFIDSPCESCQGTGEVEGGATYGTDSCLAKMLACDRCRGRGKKFVVCPKDDFCVFCHDGGEECRACGAVKRVLDIRKKRASENRVESDASHDYESIPASDPRFWKPEESPVFDERIIRLPDPAFSYAISPVDSIKMRMTYQPGDQAVLEWSNEVSKGRYEYACFSEVELLRAAVAGWREWYMAGESGFGKGELPNATIVKIEGGAMTRLVMGDRSNSRIEASLAAGLEKLVLPDQHQKFIDERTALQDARDMGQ